MTSLRERLAWWLLGRKRFDEMQRLRKEVKTMRAFNSLLIGEAGIWIPCVDCHDYQASRYFNHETIRLVPERPKPDTIRIKKE